MFPNVRLLIGALVVSVVALTCGFGLFAAFRVNHVPLSQLPVGNSSVQLVANEVATPRTGWGTPFDGQSRVNGSRQSEAVTEISPATPVSQSKIEASSLATAGPIKPAEAPDTVQHDARQPAVATPTPIIATAPPTEVAQPAAASSVLSSTAKKSPASSTSAAAPPPADSATTPASSAPSAPDQTASVPPPAIDARSPTANATPSPDPIPAQATTATASPPPAPEQSATVAPAVKQEGSGDSGEAAKAVTPAITTTPDQSAAVMPPAEQTEATLGAAAPANGVDTPAGKIEAKKEGKAVRKPLARRRVAIRKRIVRKLRPRTTVQNSGFGDQVFQSAPNFSSASASGTSNSSGWSNGH